MSSRRHVQIQPVNWHWMHLCLGEVQTFHEVQDHLVLRGHREVGQQNPCRGFKRMNVSESRIDWPWPIPLPANGASKLPAQRKRRCPSQYVTKIIARRVATLRPAQKKSDLRACSIQQCPWIVASVLEQAHQRVRRASIKILIITIIWKIRLCKDRIGHLTVVIAIRPCSVEIPNLLYDNGEVWLGVVRQITRSHAAIKFTWRMINFDKTAKKEPDANQKSCVHSGCAIYWVYYNKLDSKTYEILQNNNGHTMTILINIKAKQRIRTHMKRGDTITRCAAKPLKRRSTNSFGVTAEPLWMSSGAVAKPCCEAVAQRPQPDDRKVNNYD